MPLIVEDGTGMDDANSYAEEATGDDYAAAHLYADAWTAATTEKKEAALQMATRTIDAAVQFNGRKVTSDQSLQWPRTRAEDPDADQFNIIDGGNFFPETSVPKGIVDATCELAIALLTENRTADPDGRGLRRLGLGKQDIEIEFDPKNERQIIPDSVKSMLNRFGQVITSGSGSGVVKLTRA